MTGIISTRVTTGQGAKKISDLRDELLSLSKRVSALESKRSDQKPLILSNGPSAALDSFATGMMTLAISEGFKRTIFVRCPSDYYEWPLSKRRQYLNATSTDNLCKSIVLTNTRHPPSHKGCAHVCVILQYGRKLLTAPLERAFAEAEGLRAKDVHLRLAEDCEAVSGYVPNGVCPLGLHPGVRLYADARVEKLSDGIWLGGGEVDLKWRVTWAQLEKALAPVVARHISEPE